MRICRKINKCYKIIMILDKDLLDFQYAEATSAVCNKCRDLKVKEEIKDC